VTNTGVCWVNCVPERHVAFIKVVSFSKMTILMGGGTFFKVGGHKCTLKRNYSKFVVGVGNCDVTSIEI